MKKLISILIISCFFIKSLTAQPLIGAQIWIEPGQTQQQIDTWFKLLAENNMPVARLFLMWNYIETQTGQYDFSLYDYAFRAAEKYNIKIEATLTANHGTAFIDKKFWYRDQDGQIPTSEKQIEKASAYISAVINQYKMSPALDYWWLQNEPGQLNSHDELAMSRYKSWLKTKYITIDTLNRAWLTNFSGFAEIEYDPLWDISGGFSRPAPYLDWNRFWRDYMTEYLQWLAREIRKHDSIHPLTVNPHAVYDILPKYDLPAWRGFLNTLGASVHPSWHLSMFNRDRYALGISGICDIIRGASEPHPFWVSELQAGNNIWSGGDPLCPTTADISQWLWTGIGSGAEKIIFWCLNWRRFGGEAGEWSLLDFQNSPSERLTEVKQIAGIVKNESFFKTAKPVFSDITILLSPETMLILSRKANGTIEGKKAQAHIQAAMACYEALQEYGIPVNIKQFDDFNWQPSKKSVVILPNMVAIPVAYISKIRAFVEQGNKIIATGLTGYFDENEVNVFQTGFPLKDVFGAEVKEVKLINQKFSMLINGYKNLFPVHMWISELNLKTATPIAYYNAVPVACKNLFGAGEAVWVPDMIDMGAWLYDNTALAEWLKNETKNFVTELPFNFKQQQKNVLLKILKSDNTYVTIITNGGNQSQSVKLNTPGKLQLKVIYNNNNTVVKNNEVILKARGTIVIKWE